MKIEPPPLLFVIPSLRRGGAERVIQLLSRELTKTTRVIVAIFDGRDAAFTIEGKLVDLNLPAATGLLEKVRIRRRRVRALQRLIDEEKPSQVIGFLEAASIPLAAASKKSRWRPHVTVAVRCHPKTGLMLTHRLSAHRLYPSVDRIVLQTERARALSMKMWGNETKRYEVIPNPLDKEFLAPLEQPSLRRPLHVMAFGRLSPEKGYDVLIKAAGLCTHRSEIQLTIYGEGAERAALETLVREQNMEHQIKLPGATNDVRSHLDQCSIFVMSSHHEGFPNALAEAMARGCACISTNCETGPAEMIKHSETGLLVEVNDAQALAQALDRLLVDEDLRNAIGARARAAAEAWALEKIAPRWLTS